MRERLPHSNKRHGPTDGATAKEKPRHLNHSSKEKGRAGTKHRQAVGIGVVTELTSGGHAQAAGAYFTAGNSCEQAVFASFSNLLGLSMVGALQAAPRRKERGKLCGAYIAGRAVLERLFYATTLDQPMEPDDGTPVDVGSEDGMKQRV